MTRRIATYRADDGTLLTGQDAYDAWADQVAVCACRSVGTPAYVIAGTAGDLPAKWLGCPNCGGTALGRPLVYRLPSQMED